MKTPAALQVLVEHGTCNTRVVGSIPTGDQYEQIQKYSGAIVQVLPLKKMREACNFHHRYTSTMTDKMRKKIQKITL